MTLGERCVQWSLARLGLKEIPPGSNDGPEIREWRKHCVRGFGAKQTPLKLGPVQWCSLFACESMRASLQEFEVAPHGFRAGAIEIVEDARDVRNLGCYSSKWVRTAQVLDGTFQPKTGDLAIYDRSQYGKPETTWWRHVNRVISFDLKAGTYTAVGGNEGIGEVKQSTHSIHEPKLMGFVVYPE